MNLAVDWAWPEDIANPLSHLTLLTNVDLTANGLTHLGCDVMASLRSLSGLVVADNLVSRLHDVSLQCAGPRLTRVDVSRNRLTQLTAQSLSTLYVTQNTAQSLSTLSVTQLIVQSLSTLYVTQNTAQSLSTLSGLQVLDARANPLLCEGDAACVARRNFRRWLNDTVRRLVLARHADDAADEYACQDSEASYVSGRLDCDEAPPTLTAERSTRRRHGHQYTGVILVSISALTVLIVATFILVLGLVVGRRYWRRSDVDYCKHRQSQLLQHEHPAHQLQDGATSSRLHTLVMTWLRRCCSTRASTSSVGYRQVIGAELDMTSSSADVNVMTSS